MSQAEIFRLQPSRHRLLVCWLVVMYVLGIIAIGLLQWPSYGKWILLMALTLYLIWQLRHHVFGHTRYAVKEARFDPHGGWELLLGNGASVPAQLSGESFIRPWLIILIFNTAAFEPTRQMVLFPDSLDSDLARRLRVQLQRTASDEAGR